MINKTEDGRIIDKLNSRYPDFFKETSVENYIEKRGDEWFFKAGIIPNIEIWEDIKCAFRIRDTPCPDTYPTQK